LGRSFGGRVWWLNCTTIIQDMPDEDLLRHVAAQGWVILTLDKRMRYREAQTAEK
jgi:hypothetical protein